MRIEANMGRGEGEEEGTEGQTHYVVEQFVAEVRRVKIIKKQTNLSKKHEMPCSCLEMFWGFILSFMQQGRFANVAKMQR